MSYNITLTNGNILTQVPDTQSVSTYGGLNLIGKFFPGYGTALNNNLVHMIENFASSTPPVNPFIGQIWFDSVAETIKFWNGSSFKPISVITTSPTEPLYPQEGDEWFNGTSLYIWNGYTWILIGPPESFNGGKEGFITAALPVAGGNLYYLQLWSNGNIMGVVSSIDIASPGLSNFGSIRKGFNFVTNPDPSSNVATSGIYNASEISIGLQDEKCQSYY
jgi:hypothetical protein